LRSLKAATTITPLRKLKLAATFMKFELSRIDYKRKESYK